MDKVTIPDSERLTYGFITEQDTDLLFELDQDPDVMRYINGGKVTTMEDVHNIFVPRLNAYSNQEKGWGLWKVFEKDTNDFIGWVLVRPLDFFSDEPTQFDNLELGWRFKQKTWGKGYGTEAAQAICNELAKLPDVKYLCALAVKENAGSINIMKKLGMRFIESAICKDPLGDLDVVHYQMENT
ncbi:GNAT family N-acetyltransferase [Thalassotalea eurytherma]|uniref:GNAT family acetyltransferase n=1 Tax=Thalassotalea eurytherma TaxID=1144278 RepID=A0ABQ6H6P1_9GAMM|nr:GNAT family N-acetyltransferase [Thalassotalea eurytherma]GLX82865.1 GNAT family acetyltransferase [Thalassotalea eurytherma]